jgi:ABC-type transporter Mla subunit MlaD
MSDLEPRFTKIDDAIQRLASVAADLSKMLAVQEQRINQQEKTTEHVTTLLERRREEIDKKFDDVYDAFRKEDTKIVNEVKLSRESSTKQHEEQNQKIGKIQQFIWMAIGGGVAVGYILSLALNYLKASSH